MEAEALHLWKRKSQVGKNGEKESVQPLGSCWVVNSQ
jgi:hypothetical protein